MTRTTFRSARVARLLAAAVAVVAALLFAATPASAHGHDDHHDHGKDHGGGFPSALLAATFVAPNGTDSATCAAPWAPCHTIARGVANTSAGGTVIVLPGIYAEDVHIAKPLKLFGVFAAIDASHMVNGIVLEPGSSGSLVHGFVVMNADGEGLLATGVSNVTIAGNIFANNDRGATNGSQYPPCLPSGQIPGDCGEALHLQGTTNSRVTRNWVVKNVGGILVSDDVAPSVGNVIDHNVALDNAEDCGITLPSHTPGMGVYHNLVEFNVSARNGGAGILLAASAPGTSAHDNAIRNNIIVANGEVGVQLHAHAPNQSIDNNVITGNLIDKNNLSGDPDAGDMETTGVLVFSAVVPVHGTVVQGNHIMNNTFGIWLSANVDASGISSNTFTNVTTPVHQ